LGKKEKIVLYLTFDKKLNALYAVFLGDNKAKIALGKK